MDACSYPSWPKFLYFQDKKIKFLFLFIIFNSSLVYCCRRQHLSSYQLHDERRQISTLTSKDLGQELDTTMQSGPLRPSRFLEERRWPPLEMFKNRWKVATDSSWLNACSEPDAHQISNPSRSAGATYNWKPDEEEVGNNTMVKQSLFNSHDSIRNFRFFKATFEPPFRLEVMNNS